MKLPNTIISLIFNQIEEKQWLKLYFLFIYEIEWKINHLKDIKNNNYLEKQCKNGNIFTILKNKNNKLNWNNGLCEACLGGNLKIVSLVIKKGANDWEYGLQDACCGGHLNIVNLMIEKGASFWNWGLEAACENGHLNIVDLMIKKGAIRCYHCKKSINDH